MLTEIEQDSPSSDCAISTGLNHCIDVAMRATELFAALKLPDAKPQYHEEIHSIEQFAETFLFYFQQGSAAEKILRSDDQMLALMQRLLTAGVTHHNTTGGHSPMFC